MSENPIVLFDGVCNLCNGTVRFIAPRDKREVLRFASLGSQTGQRLLREHDLPVDQLDTFVLIEGNLAFTRSDAALRLTRYMHSPWTLLFTLAVIPRPVRDIVYDWVARNRYRWFGRVDDCPLPSPDLRARFLD